jgi:hypothetical protein
MSELWKDVVGLEEFFKISSNGRIFSKRTLRVLKTTVNKSGYEIFSSQIGGRKGNHICLRVHRLVAEAFIPLPEKLKDYASTTKYGVVPINHIDSDKRNNSVQNLEWCTYCENSKHYVESGNFSKDRLMGENNPSAKLTNEQRLKILELRTSGMAFTKISKLFGIHRSTAREVYLSLL